jgi:O-antigen ligase
MPSSRPPFANAKLVQSFRGESRAPLPLHPLELTLVCIASLHLCFLPWALGGRDSWAQITSLILGVAALVVALLPRRYAGEFAPQGAFILHPWPRLLRFPIFWLGGLLLAYVACQALNSAYLRASAGPYWWLVPVEHITWLPSGISAPFELMNAWRMLVLWGAVWALGCALWIGLTRRAAVQYILTAIVANGALLALIGILQKVTNAKEVLWFIKPVATYFVSTFFYKNHAGAYFNFVIVVAISLMAWHYVRALRRLERSSPAPVYAFGAIVLASVVFMSGSRTAMILLSGYLVAAAGIFLVWRLRQRGGTSHPAVTGLVATSAVALVGTAFWFLNLDKGIEQLKILTTEAGQRMHVEPRVLARQATLDLFHASPATGWGAGSFSHSFPMAQKNYPEIYQAHGKMTFSWSHAHNDYVEALAEVGVIGFTLLVLMPLWLLVHALRNGALGQPAYLLFLLGLALPLAHAWVDFPLYNPAILFTLCASAVMLVRWIELESKGSNAP